MGGYSSDAFSPYEHGIRYLLNQIPQGHPRYREVSLYQQRFGENLSLMRRFGDTEVRRAERARIIEQLNEVSLSVMHMPFERLCSHVAHTVPAARTELIRRKTPLALKPFGEAGRITDPERFFNRQFLLDQIFEVLEQGGNVSLVGDPQMGKSSILSMICALGPQRLRQPYDTFAYMNLQLVDNEDDFYELLCEQLDIETCRGFKLSRALRGRYHILCLDEIEKMSWDGFTREARSQLRGLADGAGSPLKLVIASHSPLSQIFPDAPGLDSPLANICIQFDVHPFSSDESREFIETRLKGTGVTFTEEQIALLLADSKGNPARLQRAAASLYRGYTSLVERQQG